MGWKRYIAGLLLTVGVIGFAIALIYALFWAGEQSRWNRRWGRPRYGPDEPTRRVRAKDHKTP